MRISGFRDFAFDWENSGRMIVRERLDQQSDNTSKVSCNSPCLWFLSPNRQSFGDAKCHPDTFRAITNICFEIAIYSEPEAVPSELDARTDANSPLLRIRDILAIDLMVRQLLQPIAIEAYAKVLHYLIRSSVVGVEGLPRLRVLDAEAHKWVRVDRIP